MAFLSEDDLRQSNPQYLERWANWLGIVKRPGKNAKEEFSNLVFGILRAVRKLEKLPRGTIPSEIKKKQEKYNE